MARDCLVFPYGWAVAVITLLALGLRLTGIDGPSLKLWDDFITLAIADQPGPAAVILQLLGQQQPFVDFQPPLYYLIVHWCLGIARSDFAVRLPGVLAGTLAVPAVYVFVRRLFTREAAFFASAIVAVSIYQIEYSQQVRPYALFLTLSLVSMWLFCRLAEEPRAGARGWAQTIIYAVVSCVMCLTSYLGLLNLLCQGVWYAGRYVLSERQHHFRRSLPHVFGGFVLTGCFYLPWFVASSSTRSVLSEGVGARSLELSSLLWEASQEFFSYYNEYLSFHSAAIPFLVLVVLGAIAGVRSGKWGAFSYLLCWMVLPLAVLVLRESHEHHLRIRYLMGLYSCLAVLAGLGLNAVTARLSKGGNWKSCLAGLVLLTAVSYPNWATYSYFFRRDTDGLKDLAQFLEELNIQPDCLVVVPGNALWSPRLTTQAIRWYLPGSFEALAQLKPSPYRRVAVLVPDKATFDPGQFADPLPIARFRGMNILAAGLVNRSPVPLVPDEVGALSYRADIGALQVFGDVSRAANLVLEGQGLAVDSKEDAGNVDFRFVRPEIGPLEGGTIRVAASFTPSITGQVDSSVTVLIRAGDGSFQEIGRLVSRDAPAAGREKVRALRADLSLPPEIRNATDFEIRLVVDNTKDYGRLVLNEFSLEARAQLPGSEKDGQAWFAGRVRELSRRLGARSQREGVLPVCRSLIVDEGDFARSGGTDCIRRDGARPIYSVRDAHGDILADYYDPGLDRPAVTLGAGQAVDLSCWPETEARVQTLRVSATALSELDLGGVRLPLDMSAPPGSVLTLGPTNQARLSHSPRFDDDLPQSGNILASGALVKKKGETCLSCSGSDPCSLEYAYESGLPISGLRFIFFPRVFAGWRFKNHVRVLYSLDGGLFQPLYSMRGSASGSWEGLSVPRVVRADFARPAAKVRVRFELSGDGAQIWSSDDYPMRLEFFLAPPAVQLFPASCPILLSSNKDIEAAAVSCRVEPVSENLWKTF